MTTFRTVRIDVTQDDIDHGEPLAPCECPVALALRRIFPGAAVAVIVGEMAVDGWLINPPAAVNAFIEDFDHQGQDIPGPFSFELRWNEATGGWAAA